MSLDTWLAFFVAAWAICLSPGPGVLSSVTAGLSFGYRGAAWNLVGLQVGALLMLLVVGVGLGTVLAASPAAFEAIKWFGAAYLVWLGIQQWRARASPIVLPDRVSGIEPSTATMRPASLILRGFLVNSSNPKGMLFTASVLPQFIDVHAPLLRQYGVAELTLLFTDVISMSLYTALGTQAVRLMRSPAALKVINRVFGTLFIVAGIALALFRL